MKKKIVSKARRVRTYPFTALSWVHAVMITALSLSSIMLASKRLDAGDWCCLLLVALFNVFLRWAFLPREKGNVPLRLLSVLLTAQIYSSIPWYIAAMIVYTMVWIMGGVRTPVTLASKNRPMTYTVYLLLSLISLSFFYYGLNSDGKITNRYVISVKRVESPNPVELQEKE